MLVTCGGRRAGAAVACRIGLVACVAGGTSAASGAGVGVRTVASIRTSGVQTLATPIYCIHGFSLHAYVRPSEPTTIEKAVACAARPRAPRRACNWRTRPIPSTWILSHRHSPLPRWGRRTGCHDCQVEAAMITGALLGVAVVAAHILTKAGPGINPLLPSSDPRLGVG